MHLMYIMCIYTFFADVKAPFSIATTVGCERGCYSIPWIVPPTLDPCLIMLSAKQRGIKYLFLVFGMIQPGIEPQSPGLLAKL